MAIAEQEIQSEEYTIQLRKISQANNTTTTLSYDAAKRLSSIIHSGSNGAISSFNYGYDNHGNRISQTEIVQDGGGIKLMDKTYSYNNRNQLSGLVDTVNSANNVSYTYDANGNQLSKIKGNDTTLFDYDSRNQLRRIRQNGVEQGLYLYDHQGMRISKTENGQQTKYLYDGKSVLQQYQNSADVKSHYFYGNNQLLQLHHVDEGLQYYHLDSLGSVVNLTLDNGSVQARYSYDAFGHTRQQAGSSANSFGFTGHEMDHNTGLIYMKARFYDPDVGRFLNQDSYEGTLDTPPSLHKYLYAYSNPLYYVDPDGHFVQLLAGPIAESAMAAGAANSQQNWNRDDGLDSSYDDVYGHSIQSTGFFSGIAKLFGDDSEEIERRRWNVAMEYYQNKSRIEYVSGLPYSEKLAVARQQEINMLNERQMATHKSPDWVYISRHVNKIDAYVNHKQAGNAQKTTSPTISVEDDTTGSSYITDIAPPLPEQPGFTPAEPYFPPYYDQKPTEHPSVSSSPGFLPVAPDQIPSSYVTPIPDPFIEWNMVYNQGGVNSGTKAKSTSTNSKELRKNLEADGRAPLVNEDAAHIVASTHKRHQKARAILKQEGIGVNDAINGGGLPKNSKVPNPQGKTTHNQTHTYEKLDKVTRMLQQAQKDGTVKETLKAIEQQRQSGTF